LKDSYALHVWLVHNLSNDAPSTVLVIYQLKC